MGASAIAAMMPPISSDGIRTISQPSRWSATTDATITSGSDSAGGGTTPRTASCGDSEK